MGQDEAGHLGGHAFPKIAEAFASFARKMDMDPDLIETALGINKHLDNVTSPKLYVKEQSAKDQYIRARSLKS